MLFGVRGGGNRGGLQGEDLVKRTEVEEKFGKWEGWDRGSFGC